MTQGKKALKKPNWLLTQMWNREEEEKEDAGALTKPQAP